MLANFKDTILLRVLCNFLQAEWCVSWQANHHEIVWYFIYFCEVFFFSIVVIEFDVFSKSWIKFCTLWWKDEWESLYKGLRLSFVSRLSVRCWPQRFDRGKQVFIMLSDDLLLGTSQYLSSRRDRRNFFFGGGGRGGDRIIRAIWKPYYQRLRFWVVLLPLVQLKILNVDKTASKWL